jgi:hypothetical protein
MGGAYYIWSRLATPKKDGFTTKDTKNTKFRKRKKEKGESGAGGRGEVEGWKTRRTALPRRLW